VNRFGGPLSDKVPAYRRTHNDLQLPHVAEGRGQKTPKCPLPVESMQTAPHSRGASALVKSMQSDVTILISVYYGARIRFRCN